MSMSNNILKGKKGIIFGALNTESIAWQVAQKCHDEGATFVLTNTAASIRMGELAKLADYTNSLIIPADASNVEDLEKLVKESIEHLGGKVDFVLHSVGMSRNIRKQLPYQDISYNFLSETLDVSAISLHKLVRALIDTDALNEHASILAMTYIAAQRTFPGYSDMAQAKALIESIARSFGSYLAKHKKARINVISQSPTLTSAGSGIKNFVDFHAFGELMSPLGNATAEECADYCATLFSDYTRKVTMQTLYHDGGFSSVGLSEKMAALLPQDSSSI
ncbi:MAG: enoyl-[acyl-carrier protein] reductase I [Crocinitomicaceae bacterium]|jgi:enoyl-[acyl-carrier protein] reductase I